MTSFLKSLARKSFAIIGRELLPMRRPGANPVYDAQRLLKSQTRELTLFDVGANTGQTARTFLEYFPNSKIHSFEPTPSAYKVLASLAAINAARLQAYPYALSSTTGEVKLYLHSESVTNSLLPDSSEAHKYQPEGTIEGKETVVVQTKTLDQFTKENNIQCIDLLKTDTQGFDLQVLKGAEDLLTQGKIKLVLCEVLFVSMYEDQAWFHEIYQFMLHHNYRLVNIYGSVESSDGFASWADAMFIHESSSGQ
jgi:FkbM family methyltransferase